MPYSAPFSEDQRDCLQELTNVAMGAAGESLAAFTNTFVTLSIPVISAFQPSEISVGLKSVQTGENVSAVAQPFQLGDIECYALVVITESSFTDLAQFTGRWVDNESVAGELLTDMAKTLNDTCLNGMSEMMDLPLCVETPDVVALNTPLEALQLQDIAGWDTAISIEINYHLEDHPFNCDLLLLFNDQSADEIRMVLDGMINI
jgi:chemotaxis protein CheY-P-specific phosphatase CheC